MESFMKMEDIILTQEKINQVKKENPALHSAEAQALYDEMCECFDKLVLLTKRYEKQGR